MAYAANLKIDPLEIKDVISFDYRLYTTHTSHSKEQAMGRIEGGEFSFVVFSTKENVVIYTWLATEKKIEGEIVIGDLKTPGGDVRKIKFSDAFITSFAENFNQDSPMTLQFSLISDKIIINNHEYDFIEMKAS